MCGITGYIGGREAVATVIDNLKRLEYRGYDSAGVAFGANGHIEIVRAPGKIANLEASLNGSHQTSHIAIAHTRWATHGGPTENNAHPHRDCTGDIAVVHNGIIENYAELRVALSAVGHEFTSETDTEVIAHLIEEEMKAADQRGPNEADDREEALSCAVRRAMQRVTGSFAIAVLCKSTPTTVYAARKDSPLVLGVGTDENFIASDIPAVMRYTRQVILLHDGDFARIRPDSILLTDLNGIPVDRPPMEITWDDAAAEKGGFAHFMLKEIYEDPRTVRDTLRGRLSESGEIILPQVNITAAQWEQFRRITIVGCGTAYHAGVVGKRLFEQFLRRPVEVAVASEFRYSDPLVDASTLVILISQSGETADTLAAMREAKSKGATTLAVVNVVGSTLARDADAVLFTQAGPEIGVASTKAYLAQLTALALLGLFLMRVGGVEPDPALLTALADLPAKIDDCIRREHDIAALAEKLADHSSFFFLGRGYDFAAALEAALKLKEISYIHAEAYPAGEMKHGPLALVEPGVAVIGFCTQPSTNPKMFSNLKEVKARGGTVVAIIQDGEGAPDCADYIIPVPAAPEPFMPIISMVPMQLLAYYVAKLRGCEIDQPRNLAKSVTVE